MKLKRIILLAAVAALWSTAYAAQSLPEPRKGDTVGWHEVRAGETLSGITERYLGDSQLWPENHRLNPDIADPDRLTPGQRIRVILAREIAARRAEVEQVSRRVDKKPRADDWTSARVGDELVEREGLRTYPKSSAELGFDDGSNLVLTENSIVFLREYTSSLRRVDRSQIEVVDGGIDVAVTPKAPDKRGKEIEIVLGGVTAKPRASRSEPAKARAMKDDASTAAKLMVYAGVSEVESAGVKVAVGKGMGTSVKQGEAPAPPERLLAAPKLVTPTAGSDVSDSVEVSWTAVPRAAGYTLEVCRDESCGQLIDRQVNLTETRATTATLPGGEVFLRLTARSRSGLDGYPSAPFKLIVNRQIAGRVLVDRAGELDESTWTGAPDALVRLYSDNGDGAPVSGDTLVTETRTDESGHFRFDGKNGSYWVVADSRSASPAEVWLEQIAGPAGSLCATVEGGTELIETSGPCFGGRRAESADEAGSLEGSEHVARVVVADDVEIGLLDFVFSPSVVTTTMDDDDAQQGTLRRFVMNAAVLAGDDAMRFVPMTSAGDDKRWWTIELTGALPPIDEETVTLDGRAWTPNGELRDTNEGQVSDTKVVGALGESLAVADRPELEIFANGSSRPLFARAGTLRVRNLAIYGAEDVDLTSVGTLEIENCLVGVGADLTPAETATAAEIEVSGSGTAKVSQLFLRAGGSFGLLIRSDTSEARVTANDVELVNCAMGAGVRIESNGSSFERFSVSACGEEPSRLAFELKGTRGADNQTCRKNRIAASTLAGQESGVKLRLGAMDNTVETTLFEGVTDGIELELVMGFWVPKGNLISRNEWRAFDEPIALAGRQGVTGLRFFEGAASCADGGWAVDRALDFPGVVTLAREGDALNVSATVCPEVLIEAYLEANGELRYLGSVRSDPTGGASGQIALPPGATRIGLIATDKWNTTSRMSLHEID